MTMYFEYVYYLHNLVICKHEFKTADIHLK